MLHCSDKRDHIYAILGLPHVDVSTSSPLTIYFHKIQPDYKKTYYQLYFDLATAFVETGNLGALLPYVNHENNHPSGHVGELPSWVPDWSSSTKFTPSPGEEFELPQQNPVVDSTTRTLLVFGQTVDHVCYTTTECLQSDARISEIDREDFLCIAEFWSYITQEKVPDGANLAVEEARLAQALGNGVKHEILQKPDATAQMTARTRGMWSLKHMADKISQSSWLDRVYMVPMLNLIYADNVVQTWSCKKLMHTAGRHIGLGPATTQEGDIIVRVSGVAQPVVLRLQENCHNFIGCAWVPWLEQIEDRHGGLKAFELR